MIRVSCKQASLLASQSLDRRLGWGDRVVLRLHLLACAACTQFMHQIKFLRLAVRNNAEKIADEHLIGLSNEARVRIRHGLQRS